jgi:ZIP family zinc transporter
MAALLLAIGIGLQNFPEGTAVSIPLKRDGYSNKKAFFIGQLSGIVEPISGIIGCILVQKIQVIMPFILAFAAGAMIYVVVEELIPEAQEGKHSNIATIALAIGFVLMMVLDIALG